MLLLTDNNLIPSVETLRALDIDCIFFAGEWRNALILIHQINTIYKNTKKPTIILSDGCVDNKLIDLGKDAVEGIFITSQISHEHFNANGTGWGLYGTEASKNVNKIICEADSLFQKSRLKRWFGIHRVSDAREAIKAAMNKEFDGNYRKDDSFYVWQIQKVFKDNGTHAFEFEDYNPTE